MGYVCQCSNQDHMWERNGRIFDNETRNALSLLSTIHFFFPFWYSQVTNEKQKAFARYRGAKRAAGRRDLEQRGAKVAAAFDNANQMAIGCRFLKR